MKSKASTIGEYIEQSDPEKKEALRMLRQITLELIPEFKESMTYGMPTYEKTGKFAFAAQKRYISLYFHHFRTDAVIKKYIGDPGKFSRGKGKFHAVEFKEPNEIANDKFPFVLTTGRQLYQFHTGTMTRKSRVINQVSPTGYVEIHPDDAGRLKISDGEKVEVATRRGKVVTLAKVTEAIGAGWLFMPFHFKEGAANILTNDALDPLAKIPEYKACAARVRKVKGNGGCSDIEG